jgi:hypothetical protein
MATTFATSTNATGDGQRHYLNGSGKVFKDAFTSTTRYSTSTQWDVFVHIIPQVPIVTRDSQSFLYSMFNLSKILLMNEEQDSAHRILGYSDV